MFSYFIQRIAPTLLMMIADSGIARPRRPRLVSEGDPPVTYKLNGSGRTVVRTD